MPPTTKPYYRLLLVAWLLVVVTMVVIEVAPVLLVLFAGVLFSIILRSAAHWVSRTTRLPVSIALTLIVFIGVGVTTTAVVLTAPFLSEQISDLTNQLPHAVKELRLRLSHIPVLQAASGSRTATPADPGPTSAAATAMRAVGSSVEVLSGLVVVFFLGVYGAAQPRLYLSVVRAITPARYRDRVDAAMAAVHHNLSRWLVGRLIAMAFVGITTSIAFHLLGLPFALLLGIFAGLLTFIEYAGAVISAVPPVVLALLKSPTTAIWVLAVYTALHLIEGYVLTPVLARATVRLPPAFTLAVQVLLGVLVGPLGLTFSTPLLVVAIASTKVWINPSAAPEVSNSNAPASEKRRSRREPFGRRLRDRAAF